MSVLLASYASILDPCYDGSMYTYAMTKELIKRNYTINSNSREHLRDLHIGNEASKVRFLAKYDHAYSR